MSTSVSLNRILSAASKRNVLGVVCGGGILASMFTRNYVSTEHDLIGGFVGMALALAFVIHTNLQHDRSCSSAEVSHERS